MVKLKFLVILFVFYNSSNWAQVNIDSLHQLGVCTPHGFTIPSILGMPRSKGLEIYQERVPTHQLTSQFETLDSSVTNSVRRAKSWMVKLRGPVINKDNFKLLVGLQYAQQEFAFKNPGGLKNYFHQSLQDKPLRSAGLTLYSIKSFIGNKYLAGRATFRFNGDFKGGSLKDHQKTSLSLLYGIKHHSYKTWGFGVSYSNSFGKSSVYPILFYKHKFKPKWAVEALLPISIRLLYTPNDKNVFYFSTKLEGDNYNINLEMFQSSALYLERADFKSFFTYEREIYDFVWVAFSTGVQLNLNFDVSDSDLYFDRNLPIGNTDNLRISSNLSPSPFFRFGLFLVPPRNWKK